MNGHNVLVPYNFTGQDRKALEFVIQTFMHLENCDVTLFNVYTPIPETDKMKDRVMERMQSNLQYLRKMIKDQEENLKAAKAHLVAEGFPENRVKISFKPKKRDIATQIIQEANNRNISVVVLNRKPGKISRFYTGSVFNKVVVTLKQATICIVN